MSTIDEVIQAYNNEHTAITELDGALAEEYAAINHNAAAEGRRKTDAEYDRQDQITAHQKALADLLGDLALDSLDNLNDASDVDTLNARITAIKKRLDQDLEDLKQKEEYAAKAAEVLTGMATIVETVVDLKL